MKFHKSSFAVPARPFFLIVVLSIIATGLLCVTQLSSAQSPDARPRRTGQTVTPSPTPTPVSVRSPNQTPATRAATPTPTPASIDRMAPKLGEPPPPPR